MNRASAIKTASHGNGPALWIGSLILCLISTLDMFWGPFSFQFDFKSFYCAAAVAHQGGNYYDFSVLQAMAARHCIPLPVWPYLYPPLFAEVAAPLSIWPVQTGQKLWMLSNVIAGSAVIVLTFKFTQPRTWNQEQPSGTITWLHLSAAIALFHLMTFRHNLFMGQINIIVLLLITASLYAYSSKRDMLSGILLALAILIKMSPALLILFYIIARRPRIVVTSVVASFVLALLTMLFFGFSQWNEFFRLLPYLAPGQTVPGLFSPEVFYNFSLAGFFSRWYASIEWVKATAYLCAFVLTAIALICIRRSVKTEPEYFLLPLLIMMIIAAPLAYIHHTIYLFPAIWLVAVRSLSGSLREKILCGFLICAAAVAGIDFPARYGWFLSHHALSHWMAALVTSLNLYALLIILFLTCVIVKLRPPR